MTLNVFQKINVLEVFNEFMNFLGNYFNNNSCMC